MTRWLYRLFLAWRDRPDPAWHATGIQPRTALDYEQDKASALYRKSRGQTATGRRYAKRFTGAA